MGSVNRTLLKLNLCKKCWLGLWLAQSVKHFTSTITMHTRLDLVFGIQRCGIDVSPKEEAYVCANFVVRKQDSSKIKVKIIRTIRILDVRRGSKVFI